MPETISVTLGGGTSLTLSVEEFHPVDRAAYQLDPGWTCFSGETDTEYFVSMDGTVYLQPENVVVGVAPEIKEAADRLEAQMDCDPGDCNDYKVRG